MKKFFLALIIFLNAVPCAAEQPAAEKYRQIFMSGNFYVEYDDKNVKRIVAQENGRRMARNDLGGNYRAIVSILNPLGAAFANEKYPEFMCEDGKFYKFLEKDYALMAREDQFDDENLNPTEGWATIYQSLSLPDELSIFSWYDKFHKVSAAMTEPIFKQSLKKNVGGKEYDCDRYETEIKNAAGGLSATIIFDLCYSNGELALAQSSLSASGREYEINRLVVKKILPSIPSGGFKLNGKEKIHAAGVGDMNDLLENPAFIGRLDAMINAQ